MWTVLPQRLVRRVRGAPMPPVPALPTVVFDASAPEQTLVLANAKARYTFTNIDSGVASAYTGAELMQKGLTVSISAKPGSALLSYKKATP